MCVRQNVFMLYDDLGLIVAQIYIEPRRMSEMINEFIPPLVIGLVKGWWYSVSEMGFWIQCQRLSCLSVCVCV